jgi:hypothetical protein
MKFAQIIEFTTGRIDEFNAGLDEWMARSEGTALNFREFRPIAGDLTA